MPAPAKTLGMREPHDSDGEWSVVVPRRGRRRAAIPSPNLHEARKPWNPIDSESDPERFLKLTQKLELSMKKVENSSFYKTIMEQVQGPKISSCFRRVLGSDLEMVMVIYGIGSIESFETPRLQLSLALLMKRKFDWIGGIQVFDPVLSATECQVLESFNCHVLSVNEQGRRNATKPTLFFMPHCEVLLYNNLLQENWRADSLTRIALFGNSFSEYWHELEIKGTVLCSARHVVATKEFTDEYKVEIVSDDFYRAFNCSSWHFFGGVLDRMLPSIDV